MNQEIIRLSNIKKDYEGYEALKGINLSIYKNEFLTLLGPSGCGKTTTLRIIGGFEQAASGIIYFMGENINNIPPHKRKLNTVFQKYALFPHMNVYENIAFGLKIKKVPNEIIKNKVNNMLELVNLSGYEKRDVDSLSGGQQQRIAIARALVNEPEILLLDEPLGALDLKLRKDMQIELKRIQQQLGITFIYVTHDQEEALTMSDTIVVMDKGEILQMGSPIDIYNEPACAFVADFIGESNILEGIMVKDYLVSFAGHSFECEDLGFSKNEPVDVVIRPEDIRIVDVNEAKISGVVTSTTFKGVHYEMIVNQNNINWIIHSTISAKKGDTVGLDFIPFDIHIMRKVKKIAK